MKFYYGYISGTYMHDMNHIAMLPLCKVSDIMDKTYCTSTEESKLGDFGLDKGWSSIIADKVDIDLDVVANPVRSVAELLVNHKWEEAEFMIQHMFTSNVGIQVLSIACCDRLMKFDEDGTIYEFLCKNIPMFRTTLMQRTALMLKQEERRKKQRGKVIK